VTPIIELKGFEKISLEPGKKKTVNFKLTPHELSLYNMAMDRVVEPGTFEVMVGRSCRDIRLTGSFEVAD
jgi:beta-glucosidase